VSRSAGRLNGGWPTCRSASGGRFDRQASLLQIAIERGFHSLVVLLTRNDVGQSTKNDAFSQADCTENLELVDLLLKLSWKPSATQFFRDADFITDAPFTFLECKT
jgi:hypothetical protein